MGAALSGSLPSTWNSRWPRGRCTALGMAPCSYSSGSRTSRKVVPPSARIRSAAGGSTSRMDFFASFRRSRGVGTLYLQAATSGPSDTDSKYLNTTSGVNIPPRGRHLLRGAATWKAAPMDLHEAIRRRAMVRSFATDPVDPGVVDTVLHAALRAPSAGNTAGTSWV